MYSTSDSFRYRKSDSHRYRGSQSRRNRRIYARVYEWNLHEIETGVRDYDVDIAAVYTHITMKLNIAIFLRSYCQYAMVL
jgi:hypothetical protein